MEITINLDDIIQEEIAQGGKHLLWCNVGEETHYNEYLNHPTLVEIIGEGDPTKTWNDNGYFSKVIDGERYVNITTRHMIRGKATGCGTQINNDDFALLMNIWQRVYSAEIMYVHKYLPEVETEEVVECSEDI